MTKEEFILSLKEIDALKFGSFTLKSGIVSPFYINLRDIVSYPDIMRGLTNLLVDEIIGKLDFDVITGVPYTALPIASLISPQLGKPLVYKRKEDKAYGLKGSIVGRFEEGATCLVLEDLITTGESIIENAVALENDGLRIKDVVVLVDRSADGGVSIEERGYRLHKLLNLDDITKTLVKHGKLSEDKEKEIFTFIESLKVDRDRPKEAEMKNTSTKKLYDKMKEKKSNLILSLDVEDDETFFEILDKVASEIVMLKTHIDIIRDFPTDFIPKLKSYSLKYDFLLFEDRKFADIGNTVRMQYQGGVYRIADWADFVTVHMIAGESILDGLFGNIEGRSSFLLARMSAKDNLITESYTRKVIEIGKANEGVVSGFIGHGRDEHDIRRFRNKIPPNFLLLMPGVKLESKSDAIGQTYITPDMAIRGGADCIIVGRGIIQSDNPADTAKRYRELAWDEYMNRL
jgi:uridine monophosphate synthetase